MNKWSLCGASMAPVLLGFLLVAALAAAGLGWSRSVQLQAELARARAESAAATQEVAAAREGTQRLEALETELARMRRQSEELAQLRGKVQELQRLKADHEKLVQQNQQLQQSQQATLQSLQAARQSVQQAAQRPAAPAAAPPVPPAPKPVWIGLTFNPGSVGGASVQSVEDIGPAAGSGLLPGDFVTAMDGQAVENVAQISERVAALAPGQAVVLEVERDGSLFQVRVTAQNLPE